MAAEFEELVVAAERVGFKLTRHTSREGYCRLNDAWGLSPHPSSDWITLDDAEHYIGHEPVHRAEMKEFVRRVDHLRTPEDDALLRRIDEAEA